MENFRTAGTPPFNLVLVHGGPGAAGTMHQLAPDLSRHTGVLEAFQTEASIQGQLAELYSQIIEHAYPPVILLGHSWGAWLSLMFAGRHPDLVRKLILVASAPFEDRFVPGIMETRMNRLDNKEKNRLSYLLKKIILPGNDRKNAIFREIARILKKADSFAPSEDYNEHVQLDYSIYRSVWPEAEHMRRSGDLLYMAGKVRCPVLAIHGDHDPHPGDGVRIPLEERIRDFRFVLLEKCGHEPWTEKYARIGFYELLEKEL
ncbi:hypothetical protein ES708_05685 [subsurface metagenome]